MSNWGEALASIILARDRMSEEAKRRAEDVAFRIKQLEEQKRQFGLQFNLQKEQGERLYAIDEKRLNDQMENNRWEREEKFPALVKQHEDDNRNSIRVAEIQAGANSAIRRINELLLEDKLEEKMRISDARRAVEKANQSMPSLFTSPILDWGKGGHYADSPKMEGLPDVLNIYDPVYGGVISSDEADQKKEIRTRWHLQKTINTDKGNEFVTSNAIPILSMWENLSRLGLSDPRLVSHISENVLPVLEGMTKAFDTGHMYGGTQDKWNVQVPTSYKKDGSVQSYQNKSLKDATYDALKIARQIKKQRDDALMLAKQQAFGMSYSKTSGTEQAKADNGKLGD